MGYLIIQLANTDYRPGDTIQGSLDYSKSRSVYVSAIYLEFAVYEYAREAVTKSGQAHKAVHHSKIIYFARGVEMQGAATWPFQFRIPNNLPSSVSHPHGHAKLVYELRAEVDAPGAGNMSALKILNVVSTHDMLTRPSDPVLTKAERTFFFSKHPLVMQAKLDIASCAPGADIFAHVEISNDSNKQLSGLGVAIVQNWKLSKEVDRVVSKEYKFKPPEFPIATGQRFKSRIGFKIPTPLPNTVVTAKLFGLTYSVEIKCFVGDTAELTLSLPLVISHAAQNVQPPAQTTPQPANNPHASHTMRLPPKAHPSSSNNYMTYPRVQYGSTVPDTTNASLSPPPYMPSQAPQQPPQVVYVPTPHYVYVPVPVNSNPQQPSNPQQYPYYSTAVNTPNTNVTQPPVYYNPNPPHDYTAPPSNPPPYNPYR